jgi:hypothetical protein
VTQTVPETLQIESPYFNPFGAPLLLASVDSSIVIAATYTRGNIVWSGTQIGGSISGTLVSTQGQGHDGSVRPNDESSKQATVTVSGNYLLKTLEHENLVTGTAVDEGTISWSSMTPSSLNARGDYNGNSTIPIAPSADCSPTGLPGTCTMTTFQSAGHFRMNGMSGKYSTEWGIPGLLPVSTVSASVSQQSSDD